MRILIVEDDPTSQLVLAHLLDSYGECVIADDGQRAIDEFTRAYAQDKLFDLILMDIMMPGMDGKEAVRRIRGFEKDFGVRPSKETRIIMITALDDPKTVIDSYKGGATAYITKPVKEAALRRQLQEFGLV